MRSIHWVAVIAGAVLLVACGGGAGSPDSGNVLPPEPPGPPQFPDGGTPGPGPWSTTTFTNAQGLLESPIIGTTTDESQNLWVATPAALYLLQPGQTTFTRFDAADGLHLASNPVVYCDSQFVTLGPGGVPNEPDPSGLETGTPICPISGAASAGGIAEITGGAANEVFVGYNGTETGSYTKYDPNRHSGKMDRVRLNGGTLSVTRFDFVSSYNTYYWHNRSVERLVYDHFIHPGELYVGTQHGVNLILPNRSREPLNGEWFNAVNLEWMADHLHPRVCNHAPCVTVPGGGESGQKMGDWRGVALSSDGTVWVGGKWSAGAIRPVEDSYRNDPDPTAFPRRWVSRPGAEAFSIAFGDPYSYASYAAQPGFINEPVFRPPMEGDPVHISAVSVAPDGRIWFASAPGPGFPAYGLAVWNGVQFTVYSPTSELGLPEESVQDLVALPDGRLALGFRNSGVVLWDPGTRATSDLPGLADPYVQRLELDETVFPAVLHVSTNNGATLHVLP